jgi:hypothetical protein
MSWSDFTSIKAIAHKHTQWSPRQKPYELDQTTRPLFAASKRSESRNSQDDEKIMLNLLLWNRVYSWSRVKKALIPYRLAPRIFKGPQFDNGIASYDVVEFQIRIMSGGKRKAKSCRSPCGSGLLVAGRRGKA